jgi:hypothetical protein
MPDEELQAIRTRNASAGDFYKTTEQGAATSVWCTTSRQLDGMGGVYCEDCDVAEPVPGDSTRLGGVKPWAVHPDLAERPWAKSEAWTGVRFAA